MTNQIVMMSSLTWKQDLLMSTQEKVQISGWRGSGLGLRGYGYGYGVRVRVDGVMVFPCRKTIASQHGYIRCTVYDFSLDYYYFTLDH